MIEPRRREEHEGRRGKKKEEVNNLLLVKLYYVRLIDMIPVGAGSPTIVAKNRQSQKPAPAYVLWTMDQIATVNC
ncbi:MAG: hypothetical protein EAZ78_03195 [Oscillatoriales cyanobacterium]|uniref:Uncharacterized protein n=1 Tax=Microcoleus anatoxicus PTRS2 TaxID=2705321 RepID=A0ABU8YK03_9CYAN|nr:MAG: hypothetical protein EA000_11495 [Oscillatoriales cyanobacterium]TAD98120.1 MAG: hypothetical protein EAZ98_07665 [Oscillatoriales cyanobacterium]TAE06139.1 MAG: hypothetical protein EAZ96_03315 [Oscillatoriales cyanobacterium]TAF06207.1 MAG: hypothetical protein EAZ78_03195 [Oscillatoriales cyanobacterium]TAF47693.1 MAG: hypothetical protein EAZ68_01255 [Oscillatoriales cyanobacterium]